MAPLMAMNGGSWYCVEREAIDRQAGKCMILGTHGNGGSGMATRLEAFDGAPAPRRELWLRQLMRKWGSLSNTGASGFNRDVGPEVDVALDLSFESDVTFDCQEELEERVDVSFKEFEEGAERVEDFGSIISTGLRVSSLVRGQSETLRQQFIDHHQYRVEVHTWNVAGKPPPEGLDLEGWINNNSGLPADIYVFGFQEVVPLNANNVLCVEDEGPAALWEAKIRETLNKSVARYERFVLEKSLSVPLSPRNVVDVLVTDVPEVSDVERLLAELNSQSSPDIPVSAVTEEVIVHNKDLITFKRSNKIASERSERCRKTAQNGDRVWRAHVAEGPPPPGSDKAPPQRGKDLQLDGPFCPWNDVPPAETPRQLYSRVASKQMVGLFITVWIRSHLRRHVHNVQVSTVGCGLMNHLGNKGSISVSMFLHYTSFCFVCSHLTSGNKEGDALRRNADVAEILRRTKFPRLSKLLGLGLPETILAHDRVIWLGDLNYRLALSDKETWTLVKRRDWASLLRMDQLKLEQGEGRVFLDWQEGLIYFPPTYKYMRGSDQYHSSGDSANPDSTSSGSSKRRSPAWCDRVLWYGEGLQQLAYTREDSDLSDHRSVSATFTAEVEVVSRKKLKKACVYPVNHEFDVRRKVVPTVKPLIDVHKLHSNEVWSSLLKALTPRRYKLSELETDNTWSDLRGLLDQQAWFDATEEDHDGVRNVKVRVDQDGLMY